MQEVPHRWKVTSCLPKSDILRIASYASTSTLSNLYAAFFNPPAMNYDARMFRHIQEFCEDYQAKKKIDANDFHRFDQLDNDKIEDLCCLFDFLKNKLIRSKHELIEQYYHSGRKNSDEICRLFSCFNIITEALIRYLWLHILLGDFSFKDMSKHKYSALVLYSDDFFLKSEKSRARTKHLNCTFQNLYKEYVSVILKYAKYLGFTNMVLDDDFHLKLECFQFHYPDSLAQEYDFKRFTMVQNRHPSLDNHWHFTTDIFFALTLDNNKFTNDREYCASDHYMNDESCQDAADFIGRCSITDLIERVDRHSSYLYTNTCAGNLLNLNAYASYLLDIKSIDEIAQSYYIQFCDKYLERLNNSNPVNDTDLPKPDGSASFMP